MILSKNYKKVKSFKALHLDYRVKASSLVETIVATVISTICLSISVLVFVQVSSSSNRLLETKATQELKKKMYRDWLNTSVEDDIFSTKEYTIERIKSAKQDEKKWIEVTYKITSGRKQKTRKQFLRNSNAQ